MRTPSVLTMLRELRRAGYLTAAWVSGVLAPDLGAQESPRLAVLIGIEVGRVGGTGTFASLGGEILGRVEHAIFRGRVAQFGPLDACGTLDCEFDDRRVLEASVGFGDRRGRWSAGIGAGVMTGSNSARDSGTLWPYAARDWRRGHAVARIEARIRRVEGVSGKNLLGPSVTMALGLSP